MRLISSLLVAAALALGIFAQSSHAQPAGIISANFVGGQNGAGGGGGSASVSAASLVGYVPAPNWNNLTPATGGPVALVNHNGAAAATVSWTSPNTWAATGAAPGGGGNADMMSGYLDNFGGQTISVSGLGPTFTSGGYDVYVYFNNDSATVQGYTATDNLANSDTAFGRQSGGAGTNYPLFGPTSVNGFVPSIDNTNSGATQIANAIKLTGLTGSSFTITGVNGAALDGRARPNGFQIVSLQVLPEPASLAVWSLVGVVLAGFGYFRLRRKK
jgi:hypothetical protein